MGRKQEFRLDSNVLGLVIVVFGCNMDQAKQLLWYFTLGSNGEFRTSWFFV